MRTRKVIDIRGDGAIISSGIPTGAFTINSYFSGKQKADLSNEGSALFFDTSLEGGEKMRRLNKRGQSTLEYVIIWTAIVAAILLAANAYLRPAIEGAVESTSNKITTEVGNLTGGIGN